MAKDTRLKSKSDYSLLRNRHKNIPTGTIFENDLMTISKMDELFSDQIPIASDSNFKFSYRGGLTSQKKHYRGTWNYPDETDVKNEGTEETSENRIKLNPDYTSISDFAYYGSALDMFSAAVNNVSKNFPGELYFTGLGEYLEDPKWSGYTYFDIENDYDIDVHSLTHDDKVDNTLRYFCDSLRSYVFIKPNGFELPLSEYTGDILWRVEQLPASCQERKDGAPIAKVILFDGEVYDEVQSATSIGEINIYVIQEGDTIKLSYIEDSSRTSSDWLHDCRIRPNKTIVNKFFDSLSPFESAILNRKTNPLFSTKFDSYEETDYGVEVTRETYTWPSSYNYSPLISGFEFQLYLEHMIKLCSYADEYKSNNIWRKLTHESIKNLDWTFLREIEDSMEDMSDIDATRIEAMCKLYGRNYDDIKMYIESIKNSETVTYNKMGNTPDYCLSDIVSNKGFEPIRLDITNDKTVTTEPIYPGQSIGYTSSDVNIEFFRRLILNSKHLFSEKGTRKSLDEMLSLFGMTKDDYSINEYVVVAKGFSAYTNFTSETKEMKRKDEIFVKYPLLDDIEYINSYRDSIYTAPYGSEESMYRIYGLPMAYITSEKVIDGNIVENTYAIPWFSKNTPYDGNLYFQEYGGWGEVTSKRINLDIAPNISAITSDNLFQIYSETIPPLKFAKTLKDLQSIRRDTLKTGDLCYVTDISNLMSSYSFNPNDSSEKTAFNNNENSHYFVLETIDYNTCIGFFNENQQGDAIYGWRCILESEYNTTQDKLTDVGRKLLYYESIIDETDGNNPHGGNNKYDMGYAYIEAMTRPFRNAAKNEDFSWFNDPDAGQFLDYGFDAEWCIDNRKCWYFNNPYVESGLGTVTVSGFTVQETVSVGADADVMSGRTSEMEPFNPEDGEANEEAAANSIINVKNLEIVFEVKESYKDETKEFIQNKVMPYLTLMIPSTTIFSYRFSDEIGPDDKKLQPRISYHKTN